MNIRNEIIKSVRSIFLCLGLFSVAAPIIQYATEGIVSVDTIVLLLIGAPISFTFVYYSIKEKTT